MLKKSRWLLCPLITLVLSCQQKESVQVKSPLFIDPNYHGSCDPEIVWNQAEERYFIYYTSRRSQLQNNFLATPIGAISSKDLVNWNFEGYCVFDGIGGTKDANSTFWAPAIIAHNDSLHMFVTWKPDTAVVKNPWGGPGMIVHYKTHLNAPVKGWKKVGVMHNKTLNTIDATVYKKDNLFHVWFKGKKKGKREKNELYHKVSKDLIGWSDFGFSKSDVFNESVTGSNFEEAPYIFNWKGKDWLITDPHNGLFVYHSNDGENWNFQGTILEKGSSRTMDGSMARHCSVVVKDDRAFIFYHVEPWRAYDKEHSGWPIYKQPLKNRQSVLQMAELEIKEGKLICNRDKKITIRY